MNNKYYKFKNEEEMIAIISTLEEQGYKLPFNDNKPTFGSIKEFYSRNKIFIINSYFNTLNGKYEYIIGTKQIFERNTKNKIKLNKMQ